MKQVSQRKFARTVLAAIAFAPLVAQADDWLHESHARYENVRIHDDGRARPGYVVYREIDAREALERRKIDVRQREQQERIEHGVRTGSLTRGEADRLLHEQARIRDQERAYLADGHLSRAERGALHDELNQASRHIRSEKQDSQHQLQRYSRSYR